VARKIAHNKKEKMSTYTLGNVGCYVDSSRGVYAPARIVMFANQHGARIPSGNDEFAYDNEQRATEYMNRMFPVVGACWGRAERGGNWGLWKTAPAPEEAVA
jgi:hypothetical protein